MSTLKARLAQVRTRICQAAESCDRDPDEIRLVAVSKTKPADMAAEAVRAGVTILGENYIQEARQKVADLADLAVSWHLIGHLQSNKAKYAVRIFDLIHSVDSLKLARELDRQAARFDRVQEILIQVNISRESSKSGARERDTADLLRACAQLDHLRVSGLMTMPPFFDQPERARPYFRALRILRDRLMTLESHRIQLSELSMGMTGDFEVAIEEGATLVRVGTAIFGARA
jgi:pyridoxal phosphate enzyme (YggS family)